jgi:competence protein ComEC
VATLAADACFNAAWPALLALRNVAALCARMPAALVHLPAPHWTAVAAYALGLGLGLLAWRLREERPRRARAAAAAGATLLAVAGAIAAWPLVRPSDGTLRITVLDVGQGDAIVVEAPDGRALVVDAGPGGPSRLDTGERVVAPYLWNRGILRLAAAITTHADADHAGGMAAVTRRFDVGQRWDPATMPRERVWIGGLSLLPLGGAPGHGARRPNDEAVVLRIDYGVASFLLASDATAELERSLVASGAPLAVTVLKVAHHGSRGSSTPEFLGRVRPALAVVSVGRRNAYGHPSPEALVRLDAAGATTLRTDRDGAVVFETDGRALTVTRWAPRVVERYCLDPEVIC